MIWKIRVYPHKTNSGEDTIVDSRNRRIIHTRKDNLI